MDVCKTGGETGQQQQPGKKSEGVVIKGLYYLHVAKKNFLKVMIFIYYEAINFT